ncbi:protealysin inhibitor emfourin [Solirubrobacter soli]|uniref:protealysin inhibitor emfourin n=1 Tax=Solirubrobacter soli TaxID=363832 RepID=UPI00040159B9|nr:protealysin inhibitor emfourin [Solirubrobacter soli]
MSIVRGGGVAGVATRTQLAADALPPEAGERLRKLASEVAPADDAGGRRPDELLYKVEVDGVTATHTETTLPESVRALIEFVDERPERDDAILKGVRPL